MDKNGLVIVVFVLFIVVFGESDGFNSRKLVTISDPNQNGNSNANQDSSSSPPPPPDNRPAISLVEAPKPKDTPITNPSDLESKGKNAAYTKKGSENSIDAKLDAGKNHDGKESETFASKSCKGNPICNDQGKTMMACVQDFGNGSNNRTLIVQNEQDVDLKVNITFGTPMNNYLQTFELPAHATEKVNITFSGDKSNKIILNAGNGGCELQISQPSPVNSPSESKDPKNTSNLNDITNPGDSPAKPNDVDNPAGTTAKPKDVNSAADTPAKPIDANNSAERPTEPKDVDHPAKSENENALNSKDVNTPKKSKDVNPPPKSKDAGAPPKSKEINDPSKSKEVDDPPKSKDIDDLPKAKGVDDPPKAKGVDDPSKSKGVDDPSKAKDTDDLSKSKEADDPTKSKSKEVDDPSKSTPISFDPPVSKNNVLDQLTFYSKQVTPIHGAYLAFLVALVIGGSWALCSFRKRRTGGGVPYQELEMGPTESSNAADVETVEGWDQEWDDDDWDDDKAITSPGGSNHPKTLSSNGLTSRATKKDGWDADWDD